MLGRRTLLLFCATLAGVSVLASLRPAARAEGPVTQESHVAALATTLPTSQATTEPKADETVTVARGTLDLRLDLDAVFVPVDPFEARVKTQAYQGDLVVVRAVKPGARVVKGDVLVELETRQAERQLDSATSELLTAKANFDKASADLAQGTTADALQAGQVDDGMRRAEASVKWWDDNDVKYMGGALDLNEKMQSFQVDSSADELDQLKKMYKSEDLTNETADIVLKRAVTTLDIYKQMQSLNGLQTRKMRDYEIAFTREQLSRGVEVARGLVTQTASQHAQQAVLRQTAVDAARIALDTAAEKVDELAQDVAGFTIKSEVDGVVVYGSFKNKAWQTQPEETLHTREKVVAGQVLLTVYEPRKLKAVVDLPEPRLALVSKGQKARVSPVALPGVSYEATVDSVDPVGAMKGTDQTFDATLRLPVVDARLVPGFKADVVIDGGEVANVLVLQVSAVSKGRAWVVDGEKHSPRNVVVGRSDGTNVEILTGLTEGDVVLKEAKK